MKAGPAKAVSKKDWVLLVLRESPLDRLDLMNCLYLLMQARSEEEFEEHFEFEPFFFGHRSLEAYSVLFELEREGLVIQPPSYPSRPAKYYLTARGKRVAEDLAEQVDPDTLRDVKLMVEKCRRRQAGPGSANVPPPG